MDAHLLPANILTGLSKSVHFATLVNSTNMSSISITHGNSIARRDLVRLSTGFRRTSFSIYLIYYSSGRNFRCKRDFSYP